MHSRVLQIFAVGLMVLTGLRSGLGQTDADVSQTLQHRWVYLSVNFQAADQPQPAIAILRRAKKAGYNGVLLTDYKFHVLDRVVDRYFKNLAEFKKVADELEMEIIPAVAPFGYSSGILAHDASLAEALPVIDLTMKAESGSLKLVDPKSPLIPNGGFERAMGHQASNWSFQDGAGQASFIDAEVKHSGNQSLRFENLSSTNAPHGNGRISKRIKLAPWRLYHASVWIKTDRFEADEIRLTAIAEKDRTLVHSSLGVKPTQEWTKHDVVFNSLDNEDASFYCGAWGGKTGTIWFDDVQCEEVAFVNLVRRDDCPLIVKDQTGNAYTEGRDYESITDTKLGNSPWAGEFDVYHEPPQIKLTRDSRIKAGETVRVSYFHAITVHEGQIACSLEHPRVFEIVKQQVSGVEKLLHPKRYMLSHDEIRVANWGERGRSGQVTAGQLLAENVRRTLQTIHEVNSQAKFCIWSDMFDPHHNAVKGPYYLVNGSLEGSWEGLNSNMTIINWNSGKPAQSLGFFDKLGCSQVLAGYYDDNPKSIAGWLEKAKEFKSVRGVMYTTWTNNYDHLEAFAEAAWGKRLVQPGR